ncbi:MAG TPA: tetratricopeptide repeat protein [Thermoanaerobaculia bacterium]|nr:tetratricopeptide repeat protein [Thermoanaerobaculia bacterium]
MNASGVSLATTPGVDADNPYPGLQAFGERDQAYFHGRTLEREELFRLIRREVLTVLFGRSGLGKTSLLHAGLFPRLRQADVLPVSIRLDFTSGKEDLVSQVRAAFSVAVGGQNIDAAPPTADETLWEYFHKTQLWSARNRLLTPLLVFDQFEEIFTIGRRDPTLDLLITELADLIENLIPTSVRERIARTHEELAFSYERQRVRVVFSLREDFLPQLESLLPRLPSLARNRFRLLHMNGHQALEAILKPGGELVSESVAEEILKVVAGASREDRASEPGAAPAPTEDLTEMEVEPALLSLFCRELNNRRQARGLAAITTGLVQGTHGEILSAFYKQCLVDMARPVRTFIEEQLLTDSGFRQSMPLEEALAGQGVKQEDLSKLIDRRLLRLEERFGRPQVEVIHDVMTRVIRQSRDRRRAREARKLLIRRLVLVAALLLAVVVALATFLLRERLLKREAEHQRAMADAQRVNAQEYRAKAEEMVKYMLVELRDQLKPRGDLDAIRAATKKALEYLSKVERSDHSELLRSEALTTLGDISLDDGKTADAEKNYREALVIARTLYDSERTSRIRQAYLALRLENMARLLRSRGDYTGARDDYSKALSLWEQLALNGSENDFPTQRDSQQAYAVETLNFALLVGSHEKISKVLVMYGHALGILEAFVAKEGEGVGFKANLAAAYRLQGTLLFHHGDIQAALQSYQKALDMDERLVQDNSGDVERKMALVYSLLGLGDVELFAGRGAQALVRADSATRLVQPYAVQETLTTEWNSTLALARARQGDFHLGQGDPRMALARYRECLAVLAKAAAHASDQVYFGYFLSWAHLHLGDAHDRLGNTALAHREWEKAIEIISPQLKADASETLDVYARALLDLGRLDEARPVCRKLHDREWDYRSLQTLCRGKALLP